MKEWRGKKDGKKEKEDARENSKNKSQNVISQHDRGGGDRVTGEMCKGATKRSKAKEERGWYKNEAGKERPRAIAVKGKLLHMRDLIAQLRTSTRLERIEKMDED